MQRMLVGDPCLDAALHGVRNCELSLYFFTGGPPLAPIEKNFVRALFVVIHSAIAMATLQSSLKHRRVYDVEQLPESSSVSNPPTPLSTKGSKARQFGKWRAVVYGLVLTVGLCFLYLSQQQRLSKLDVLHTSVHVHSTPHVLISYSYFEKDEIQVRFKCPLPSR